MPELFDITPVTTLNGDERLAVGTPEDPAKNITVPNFIKQYVVDADGWVTPTLNSGYSQGANPLKYRINKLGHFEMRGTFIALAAPAPANDILFTLPIGSRPAIDLYFNFVVYNALDVKVGKVRTNGEVRKSDLSAWSAAYNTEINFIAIL